MLLIGPFPSTSTSTWVTPKGVCCINPSGRGGVLRFSFSVASLLFFPLLLFLWSLLGGLKAIKVLGNWGLVFLCPRFRFFNLWVFHWLALSIYFGCWRSTTLEAVVNGQPSATNTTRLNREGMLSVKRQSHVLHHVMALRWFGPLKNYAFGWTLKRYSIDSTSRVELSWRSHVRNHVRSYVRCRDSCFG